MFDRIIASGALSIRSIATIARIMSACRARWLGVSQRYVLLYYTRVIFRKLQTAASGQFARMENRCVTAYLELAGDRDTFPRSN